MEIAIVASLLAKGNMYINTSQRISNISVPKLILLGTFFLLAATGVFGQVNQEKHEILINDSLSAILKKEKLEFPDKLDSLALIKKLNQLSQHFQSKGYLLFNYHIEHLEDHKLRIDFATGTQYKWAMLDKGNLSDAIFLKLKEGQLLQSGREFSPPVLSGFFKKIITYSEQNGYPFASVQLEELRFKDEGFYAKLNYQAGPRMIYDSLLLTGDARLKPAWLAAFLELKHEEPFNQKNFDAIETRINRLPHTQLTSEPLLTFAAGKARVELPLTNSEASTFNGVLGILPNEIEPDKILLTGYLQLDLQNLLNSGKRLILQWQSLRPLTQFIDVKYYHPNLLHSNFDLNTSFYLLKEDSTFLSRIAQLGLVYRTGPKSSFQVYSAFRNSVLLRNQEFTDVSEIDDVDYSISAVGISFNYDQFRDHLKLGKGYSMQFDASGGQKKVKANDLFPSNFFEEVPESSLQMFSSLDMKWGLPLTRQWILSQRLRAGKIFNQQLFRNDLFRLGGLKSQRGFNENYFFASDFLLYNMELRFFAEESTYLYAFTDWSLINERYYGRNAINKPLALGLGMNLNTTGGMLQIAFAVGKLEGEKFTFNNTKFHFGYLARF